MGSRGPARDVGTDFGEDNLNGADADARDGVELFDDALVGLNGLGDTSIERVDAGMEFVEMSQHFLEQKAMM